jgi:hypothetical protein
LISTQRIQEDEKRKLTELGRVQAELTGKRLREMIDAVMVSSSTHNDSTSDNDAAETAATFSCRVTALRVSDLTRAKETASIIASFLPLEDGGSGDPDVNGGLVAYHPPDPYLNEGRPCHHIPGVRATPKVIEVTDDNHKRIEEAFQKYFYRADPPAAALPVDQHPQRDSSGSEASSPANVPPSSLSSTEGPGNESLRQQQVMSTDQQPPASSTAAAATHSVQEHHEFEIIVCHANVIRYFVCRYALVRFLQASCSVRFASRALIQLSTSLLHLAILCRALQLPPEAWLRFCPFNCSLTYLTIRPTGSVSCRLLGDIGHIPYRLTSFSKHLGYNW